MASIKLRRRIRERRTEHNPPIRHKVRGLLIGAPMGDNGRQKSPQNLNVYVAGKPDYTHDANELFSFLFTKVPHGTMLELLRLLGQHLPDIALDLARRAEQLPSTPALNRRAWHDEPEFTSDQPTPAPPELPQLDLFDSP